MISDKKLANAVGGKTARACDNCVRKRARWYCAADDAFLCQTCDSSVHSANPLARRHDRVRLNTSSFKLPPNQGKDESDSMQCYPCDNTQVVSKLTQGVKSLQKASSDVSVASWHSGFTRKARSTRFKKQGKSNSGEEKGSCPHHLVPDEVSDDTSQEENVEQLLYQVPVFDPFNAELCHSSNSNEVRKTINHFEDGNSSEYRNPMLYDNQFHGSLPSEMDLAEFAADVESLLGKGLENESFHMEELGIMDMDCSFGRGEVKIEEVGIAQDQENDGGHQITTVPFEFKFDDCSLGVYEEENNIQPHQSIRSRASEESDEKEKGKILLTLDYDGVMNAWDEKKCPWTSGGRPQLDIHDNCWPYCMGTCGKVHNFGDYGPMGHAPPVDVRREARVSRYREKRRTRLFSKKIRYEVRKLNAEKRPRLKGRFVKRTSLAASAFPLLNKMNV